MNLPDNFSIYLLASNAEKAQKTLKELQTRYLHRLAKDQESADVVVALGGDGFMLQVQHLLYHSPKPVFGLNMGSIGFLLNPYSEDSLIKRISDARWHLLMALEIEAITTQGDTIKSYAFNDISIIRTSSQSVHLSVYINGKIRLDPLVADGILVSTPAGSTAYNNAAGGTILPLDANVLALTPIACFKPKGFRSVILNSQLHIRIHIENTKKRPVLVAADHKFWHHIQEIKVKVGEKKGILLTDANNVLSERALKEQFSYI